MPVAGINAASQGLRDCYLSLLMYRSGRWRPPVNVHRPQHPTPRSLSSPSFLRKTRSLATSHPSPLTLSLPAYSPSDTPTPSPSTRHSLPAPATHHRPLSTSHTGAPALSQPHSVYPSPSPLFSHPFPCNVGFPQSVVVVLAALVTLPSADRSDGSHHLPNHSDWEG